MGRFLITPSPCEGESFRGYLLRISDLNGYHSPNWLLRQLEIPVRPTLDPEYLHRLAKTLRQSPDVLSELQIRMVPNQPNWYLIGDQPAHRCTVERQRSRYCPTCLSEYGVFDAAWELKPVTSCPRHGNYLVDICDACSRPQTWNREHLHFCKCGHDLREQKSRAAPANTLALSARIFELLGRRCGRPDMVDPMPIIFECLNLSSFLNHVSFISTYATGRGRGTGRHLHSRMFAAASRETFDRTSTILMNWPMSFYEFLNEVRSKGEALQNRTGLEAEFGSFYANLYGRSREVVDLDIIRAEFEAYLRRFWTGGAISSKNTRLSANRDDDRSFLTLAEAARRVGYHPGVLRRDIEAGRLNAVSKPMKGRILRLIHTNELERYRTASEHLCTLRELQTRLGLSKNATMRLVKNNIVRATHGPTIDGSNHWAFAAADVEKFLQSISRNVSRSIRLDGLVPFEKAVRQATAKGICVSEIATAIMSGRLKGVSRHDGGSCLNSIHFEEAVFLDFLFDSKRIIQWAISIEKAARYLCLNEEATRDLVRNGFLSTSLVTVDRRLKRLVSIDSLERFKSTYISASELAIHHRTSPRALVNQLIEDGIVPITGPSVDGGRQYFLLRQDAVDWKNSAKLPLRQR